MNIYDIFVQLIGYIGLACAVVAFQCKKHKNVMIWRTMNEVLFAIQYFMLGTYTGTAMNLIGSARNIIFTKCVEKNKSTKIYQIIFSVIFVIAGLLTSTGIQCILVIGAKIITTIAYSMKNTKYIRFLTLPTCTCWLIYNIICGSFAGTLCEIFSITSIITAIIRIDIMEAYKSKKKARQNT